MLNHIVEHPSNTVLNFIQQFQSFGPKVIECFSCGMCWYFATILRERFGQNHSIVYDPIINHFATRIDGRIYDITGDITDDPQYNFVIWEDYKTIDELHTNRLYRDCILKL